jgi:hypothetical protein
LLLCWRGVEPKLLTSSSFTSSAQSAPSNAKRPCSDGDAVNSVGCVIASAWAHCMAIDYGQIVLLAAIAVLSYIFWAICVANWSFLSAQTSKASSPKSPTIQFDVRRAVRPLGAFRVAFPVDLGQAPVMRVAGLFVPTKPSNCETSDRQCANCNYQERHATHLTSEFS